MPKDDKNKKSGKSKKLVFTIIGVAFVVIALIVLLGFLNEKQENDENNVAYTQLIQDIKEGKLEEVEMTVGSTSVKLKYKGEKEDEAKKTSIIPSTQAFVEFIQDEKINGNEVNLIQKPKNVFTKIGAGIFSALPTIVLLFLVILIIQMQGLGDKGKVYDPDISEEKINFSNVAGLDEEKGEMQEIVEFLKNPKKYTEMGAKTPRGVLLCGKPGTGKTLIAKAIAGEANVPFISMSGSEFVEMFAGLGASRVRKLFERAKKVSPCIIFIDEIDAIGSRRTSSSGADTENNQTLNQLLVEMDGFDSDQSIIVIAATNRPEMLDEALLRPGRFDRRITIPLPDINGREAILKIHAKNKKISSDVNFKSLAGDTAGFTGAEIENILNEAAILATNRNHEAIQNKDIEDAVKKVTVGLEKHNRVVSEKDKKLTAYHEAGHAVVSRYLETQKDVKEISIIPRGIAGGYTMYKTNEDKFYVSKTEMEEKLIALLGGRAAEKIALDDISTGASNDIEVAMKIARDMVTIYGMSDRIGPISIDLEKDPYQMQLLGNNLEDEIGKEVKNILETAYDKAKLILRTHRDKLDQVAYKLLEKGVINEQEFDEIFYLEN